MPPKKFRVQNSAAKVLASTFWDQDAIRIEYLAKGRVLLISAGAI